MSIMAKKTINSALEIFREKGGLLSYKEAIGLGIAPSTLYSMADNNILQRLSRGIYALPEKAFAGNTDLLIVSKKIKLAVICLVSALYFHNLTTFVPREVYLALPQHYRRPRINFPPIKIIWLSQSIYETGIEKHDLINTSIKVYSIEKTIADCFKFRKKIGLDIAVSALKESHRDQRLNLERLIYYSKIDRVTNIIAPYLETLM